MADLEVKFSLQKHILFSSYRTFPFSNTYSYVYLAIYIIMFMKDFSSTIIMPAEFSIKLITYIIIYFTK